MVIVVDSLSWRGAGPGEQGPGGIVSVPGTAQVLGTWVGGRERGRRKGPGLQLAPRTVTSPAGLTLTITAVFAPTTSLPGKWHGAALGLEALAGGRCYRPFSVVNQELTPATTLVGGPGGAVHSAPDEEAARQRSHSKWPAELEVRTQGITSRRRPEPGAEPATARRSGFPP